MRPVSLYSILRRSPARSLARNPRVRKILSKRRLNAGGEISTAPTSASFCSARWCCCLLSLSSHFGSEPVAQSITPPAVDPSPVATVFNAVQGAIVRIRTATDALEHDEYLQRSSGSGVVIVNRGTIITSLHVVAGAGRIRVMFADGLESDAKIVSQHPENDLAVLQAQTVPDDLLRQRCGPRRI